MADQLDKAYTFQCEACAALLKDGQIISTMDHDRCPNCGEADKLKFIRKEPKRDDEARIY